MANSDGGWSLPAISVLTVLFLLAVGGNSGTSGEAGAQPLTPESLTQPGQEVVAHGVRVQHVAADEGFWIDLVGDRAWVQLTTPGESPYTVHDGDIVSFTGTVVAHDASFPDDKRICSPADAAALAAKPTHIDVPDEELHFGTS